MNYDFRKYLNAAGLGESAPVRRRKVNVKPKKFNPMAFAESYKFIAEDGKRMALSNNRLNSELRGIAAKGEAGAEEFKEKFKEGMAKVKKVLIELYDKIIRFFTETVRYWMSNERKVAKTISNLQSAKKNAAKKNEFSIPSIVIGRTGRILGKVDDSTFDEGKEAFNGGMSRGLRGESYSSFGEKSRRELNREEREKRAAADSNAQSEAENVAEEASKAAAEVDSAKKEATSAASSTQGLTLGSATDYEKAEKVYKEAISKITDQVRKYSAKRMIIALPMASAALSLFATNLNEKLGEVSQAKEITKDVKFDDAKSSIDQIIGFIRDGYKAILESVKPSYDKNIKINKTSYEKVCDLMIKVLNDLKGDGKTIRSVNAEIRKLTEAKRKLQDSFKENKSPSEAETLKYQIARTAITAQTTLMNLFIGTNDKLIGIGVQIAGKVASAA